MASGRRAFAILTRIVAFVATISAAILMGTSHQSVDLYTSSYEAKYTISQAFKYFVIVYSVATAYGFLVIFLPAKSLLWRLVVAVDLVMTVLLTSAASAAVAVGHVAKNGSVPMGWAPICDRVPNFCDRVTVALASGLVAIGIYLISLFYSLHTALDPLLLIDK